MPTAPTPLPVAPALPSALLLEQVGELTADAAATVARAWCEFQNGGLSTKTKMHGGDQIAQLFELWQVCAGQVDFYAEARAGGIRLLRERYSKDISAQTIAALVDTALEILQQAVRAELN